MRERPLYTIRCKRCDHEVMSIFANRQHKLGTRLLSYIEKDGVIRCSCICGNIDIESETIKFERVENERI